MKAFKEIEKVAKNFEKLPGVGKKTALRYTYALLEKYDIPVISKDFLGGRVGIVNKASTEALLKIKDYLPLLASCMPYNDEYEQNISKNSSFFELNFC